MSREERPASWVKRLGKLYSPVVADVLDKLGFRQQVMRANIRPLYPTAKSAGFALTAQTSPAREIKPAAPYAGELAAVDALRKNDILVVAACDWAFWGELLSTAAKYSGSTGVVIDGFTRDSQAIMKMKFPVFCRGIHPADSLGRMDVTAHNVPIDCGGVLVYPGDLVLADYDGVVVVPYAQAEETLRLAEEKVSGENLVRKALASGMTTAEAFKKYGIL
ncbi:MAG: RraA family protein [Planctomycetes bacterium]|nr:RraA family protein [Planctomycetota bacterium]